MKNLRVTSILFINYLTSLDHTLFTKSMDVIQVVIFLFMHGVTSKVFDRSIDFPNLDGDGVGVPIEL